MNLTIILCFFMFFVLGFVKIIFESNQLSKKHRFASNYREKFIKFAYRTTEFDSDLYVWLTKNVNEIQNNMGSFGTMAYVSAFQKYQIPNYHILINTLPKFRAGNVESFDINSSDDSLLRYIGYLEDSNITVKKKLKNPAIWFREGFSLIFGIPFYIFNWFGILSNNKILKITTNATFNIISGIGALVTFFSGIVTIIQGKDQVICFFKQIINRYL